MTERVAVGVDPYEYAQAAFPIRTMHYAISRTKTMFTPYCLRANYALRDNKTYSFRIFRKE